MDNKDTFATYAYKGGFIHTCYNRTKGVEEITVLVREGASAVPVATIIGAKRIITAYHNKPEQQA